MDHDRLVARSNRSLPRRRILNLGGGAALALALGSGCEVLSTKPKGKNGNGQSNVPKGAEAPMLAERVKAGKLPPVKERLPKSPLVVVPNERTGVYGGTWRGAITGPTDIAWLQTTVGYEMLLRWKPGTVSFNPDELIPNVAESFDVNEERSEYTFHLRESMKWSDGEPFTADDVVFAVDDILMNTDIFPFPPLALQSGGKPVKVEKVDATTVKFTFVEPSALFPLYLASKNTGVRALTESPRHYLEQFHADYNKNIDSVVKKEGTPDWIELFLQKADPWNNAQLPRIYPWVPTDAVNEGTRITFERNPYYWKVDPENSQLPYLDRVVDEHLLEEPMLLRAANGEIDMHDRYINTLQNKPVLARDRKASGYHFVPITNSYMNGVIISLNLTHKDPTKREIFRNKNFRIGLSHAINRQEIIDVAYQGQGVPWQVAPLPQSDFYNETLAKQYTEFNVDLANDYLDRAGYSKRNGRGVRLGPNGSPLTFSVQFSTRDFAFSWADVMDMVRVYWSKVGIDMKLSVLERSLANKRVEDNSHDASVVTGDPGLDPHLTPRAYMPQNHASEYAVPWAVWYESGGARGQEPSEPAKRQMDLYDRFKVTGDYELMREILTIAQEEFYSIGISYPTGNYAIVRDDFHNVLDGYINSANYACPGPTNPEQFFTTRK